MVSRPPAQASALLDSTSHLDLTSNKPRLLYILLYSLILCPFAPTVGTSDPVVHATL